MQVAARGPAGGAHLGDRLPDLDGVANANADGLQVVVGGNQPVAMVDLHPVAAAPGMPASGADYAAVGGVHGGAAGRGKVLSQVEIAA